MYKQIKIDQEIGAGLRFGDTEYSGICCPKCACSSCMEYGDTVYHAHPDDDEYTSPSGTRGGWIETRGLCSACCTKYSLIIGNHKGALTIAISAILES